MRCLNGWGKACTEADMCPDCRAEIAHEEALERGQARFEVFAHENNLAN